MRLRSLPVIIVVICHLLGCSKLKGEKATGSKGAIAKSNISDTDKRYPMLTKQIINSTPDNELILTVCDYLSQEPPHNKTEYEKVMSWNKSRQAIYMIWCLESEVSNGGYDLFYLNSTHVFYKYLPDALRLVGANKFADLTQHANYIYENEGEKLSQPHYGFSVGYPISNENNPLYDLDEKFYALYYEEDLEQLQIDYVRKNWEDFISHI